MVSGVALGLRIGLTGGIGSGKSTVAGLLAGDGAHVVDTDAISRRLTLPGGPAIAPIRAAFGADAIAADGALDRPRMRDLVFRDADAKRRLEALLHPLIARETQREAAAAPPGAAVVFDVPLLVESGRWREQVDKILVIDCSEETQVQRVVARSGWSEAAVRAVIAQQASREARRAVADAVIVNDGLGLDALAVQVRAVWRRWVAVEQSPVDEPDSDSAP